MSDSPPAQPTSAYAALGALCLGLLASQSLVKSGNPGALTIANTKKRSLGMPANVS